MKICIIASQIAGYGKIGGFGSMTRKLAESLAAEGHTVSIVVPKRGNQKRIEKLDSVTLYGLSVLELLSINIYKKIDADIYHSQNATIFSYIAQIAEPDKKHVITCRDPKSFKDWMIEQTFATWKRRVKNTISYFLEHGWFIDQAISHADVVAVPAQFLIEKVQRLYHRTDVIFLPNIEKIPATIPMKNKNPTICFVGRLEPRKRPEIVFDLAKELPQYTFLIVGTTEEKSRQLELEKQAKKYPNIKMLGYLALDDPKLAQVYDESWILINTSVREGLPLTFIEAAAHGCAIVSMVNPDSFASRFGYWAKDTNFKEGLKKLIESSSWKTCGKAAHAYVAKVYSETYAVEQHMNVYKKLLTKL